MKRHRQEKDFNWNAITLSQKAEVSTTFWSIVDDTHKFCEGKQIDYFCFLQPLRYYRPGADSVKLNPEEKGLSSIYTLMDFETIEKEYCTSLTPLFKGRDSLFIDDCHIKPEGNKLIAKAMADFIEPTLDDYLSPAMAPERADTDSVSESSKAL